MKVFFVEPYIDSTDTDTCVTNLGWYGQSHTKSSRLLHSHVLLFKLLIRSLPATLYTFCTITFMASEPLKHTRSGSMVQNVAGRPEPDSGPGPDLPAVWISPQTHQKYTVVYSELIRSLLATSYASLTIIGTSNGYPLKYTKSTRAYTLS